MSHIPLVGDGRDSRRGPGTGQADEMTAADVTGEQRGAHLDGRTSSESGSNSGSEGDYWIWIEICEVKYQIYSQATRSCSSQPESSRSLCCVLFCTWTGRDKQILYYLLNENLYN